MNASLPGGGAGGGLSDMLKGGLGGLLAGGAAGSILSGGLGDLLNSSSRRPRRPAPTPGSATVPTSSSRPATSPNALGADQIDALTSQSGLSRDELLQGLSQFLPDVVNHLTPDGRLPDENELSGRI